ncbi:taurine ABC transporter substrate-binding protein [Anaerostipes sp.]|uniref:taurine ABC transporter substrate-binding protein n=1 Tax=Anaerostipes sp. TaxID=1872530 RepID=UPI003FF14AFC
MKKSRKWLTGILLASMMVIGLSGCGSSKSQETKVSKKADTIRIGTMDLVNEDLIARAEGYYEKQLGVKVKIVKFDSGKDVNTALAAGSIDVSELGSNPTALGIGNGLNYDVIYIGDIIGSAESLVVKNRANVNSLKELKGKKIAVPFASTSHYSLLNALKQNGLTENDVKLLDMEPNDIHAAWKRGDIDAAYVWYPVLNTLQKDGKILTGSDKLAQKGILTADLIVARRDFAKSNRNLIVKYIKALNQANELDQKDSDRSIKDIAKVLGISQKDAKFQRDGFEWIVGKKQLEKEYLGGNIAEVLKNTADFLKEQGNIKKAPDLEEYKNHVNISYLKEALE